MWLFTNASYSYFMVKNQLGSVKVCFTLFGSQWANRSEGLILGKWILDLDLIYIRWILDGLKGEAELVVEDVNFELDDKMLGLWQVY